jgi:hypothetical protein
MLRFSKFRAPAFPPVGSPQGGTSTGPALSLSSFLVVALSPKPIVSCCALKLPAPPTTPAPPPAASCYDGIMNGHETDVGEPIDSC